MIQNAKETNIDQNIDHASTSHIKQQPMNFRWGQYSGQEIYHDNINLCYEEVVHWLPNLFLVPFGSAGTSLVKEIARLFQAFADNSSLQRVSMKAISVIQLLLLQKPSKRSKTNRHKRPRQSPPTQIKDVAQR